MQRIQAILLATAVAVLLMIGIAFWSGSEEEDLVLDRSGRSRVAALDGEDGERAAGARGSLRGARAGTAGSTGRLRGGELADGRLPRSERAASALGGGSADLARGGAGSRLSPLAESGGRAERGSVAFSSGSAGGSGPSRLSDSSQKEAVLQEIAAAPKKEPSSGGLDPIDPNADVVLAINKKEDTEQASEVQGVEEDQNTDQGLKFGEDTVLTFPDAGNASGDAGTITVDITPEWEGKQDTNHSLMQIQNENQWANRIELVKNGRFMRFIISDDGGKETDISYPLDAWDAGEQHRVTATWGDGQTQLWIDGQLVGENKYPGKINIPSGVPLRVGSVFGNYRGANATMSNVQVSRNKYAPGS